MEPKVNVGILFDTHIIFTLHTTYLVNGEECSGQYRVKYEDQQILWNGKKYTELVFQPQTASDSFTLNDVVIGINFHWERKEDQRFQGALKFIVENKKVSAINVLRVEDYLVSVISSEMSATASLELLKAHAVISRSWLLAQIEKNKELVANNKIYTTSNETEDERIKWYDREDHNHFDVCADDHCQRYQGITRAFSNIETVKEAVKRTKGQVLVYNNKICDARFSKCCGGVFEEFQNCWENIRHPYLVKRRDNVDFNNIPDLTIEANALQWIKERPCAYCNTQDKGVLAQVLNNYDQETQDFYRWTVEYTQNEISELVKRRSGIDFGVITDLIPIERGTSSRLTKLKIVGTKRTMIIGKELEIRRILSESHLYSSAFYVDRKGENNFILHGAGWGHGVGLCQIGAAVMGENGDKYDKILLHYYVDATIKELYK